MKTKIIALAGMLVLSLLTSVTFADAVPIGDYAASSPVGLFPETGNLKARKDCPQGTTFIKNAFPALTNGQGGSVVPVEETYLIKLGPVTVPVTVRISWTDVNSFGFEIYDGNVDILAVTSDTNNFLYDYVGYYPDKVANDSPVDMDGELNSLIQPDPAPPVPIAASDVNHLDLCLTAVDNVAPELIITSPPKTEPPAIVSGTVIVTAIASDLIDLNLSSVEATVLETGEMLQLTSGPTFNDATGYYEFEWSWPATELPVNLYTIEVVAFDGSGNEATASVTVDLREFLSECFGILGEEDFGGDPDPDGFANGCYPTILANVQVPPDTAACNVQDPPEFCYISGTLLKPDLDEVADRALERDCPACAPEYCGDYGFPDIRMAIDPSTGRWYPKYKEDLKVFEKVGIDPDLKPGVETLLPPNSNLADAVVLDENTYCANGCCAIAQHVKGSSLFDLYPAWPQTPPTGLVFIKTHSPKNVLDPNLVCECYDEDDNPDLQNACGAGYKPLDQDLDDYGFLSVLTQECRNPSRTLTRNNGFDVSNIVETAGIDFDTEPVAVLSFKYQLAEDQFGLLFAALGCAEPLLLTGKFSDVSSPVNQAKRRFDNFNPRSLGQSIKALGDAAHAIRTKTTWQVTEKNCPGEKLARIEHLIWDLGLLKRELERLEAAGIL